MNATDLLKKQHKQVMAIFKKLEKTEDPGERRELLDQVSEEIKAHSAIEERIFYPAVREVGTEKAREQVAEALEEHHVVDLVLGEAPDLDPADEQFEAKMTVLSELVRHHAEEEEKEMFKSAQKLGAEELKELGARMESEYESLKGRAGERAGRSKASGRRPTTGRRRAQAGEQQYEEG
jgi:hemerythrin superfamily protein